MNLLKPLGFTCDQEKNKTNGKKSNGIISEKGMFPAVIVIPTNEELIIAMETLKLFRTTNESFWDVKKEFNKEWKNNY